MSPVLILLALSRGYFEIGFHHHGLQTGEMGDCRELWLLLVVDEDEGRLVNAEHCDCCSVGMLMLIITGCCWGDPRGLIGTFVSTPS